MNYHVSFNDLPMKYFRSGTGFGLVGIILAIAALAIAGGGVYYLLVARLAIDQKIESATKDADNGASARQEAACSGDVAPACPSPQIPQCRNGRWICIGPASGSGAAAPGIGGTASSSAGAAAGAEAAKASVAEVTIQNFAFGPKELRVKVGTKVVWTNKDSVRHNAVSDAGTFEGPLLAAGESYEHVFDEAGTFPYHCAPHPNMKAVVIVE
ncbi:MAG: Blue (Type 1) copper domain protein [Parcubacteria group bacterium GW2011_GWC2_52_8c]|nr:MAG: Blue (Type 1) copper domain protein [Parcubacteria group bacterium GW2011_GWA1_51_12]KKW31184.1 MAG: Blue (Type 1) copper domain protein [Parcubacteria group bacterium GW2011_GWC2_52_8c]